MAPAAGELDADRFFIEEVGKPDDTPALGVPAVDVAPVPPTLTPIAPVSAGGLAPIGAAPDAPKLKPIAPIGGGDPEDAPP